MKNLSSGIVTALAALLLGGCAGLLQPTNPLVGQWALSMDTPVGTMNADIQVNEDLTGQLTSNDLGSTELRDINVSDEGDVSFETTVEAQGTMITMNFDGTVEGDSLNGSFNTDFGSMAVSGTRQ